MNKEIKYYEIDGECSSSKAKVSNMRYSEK